MQNQYRSPSVQVNWRSGNFENNLHPCGKFGPKSSKFFSLKEMTQVHSLSLRSTPEHKFLALRNEETVWETKCSNVFPMETDSCLLLLFLICVILVFLMECCNRSSLKPERPMCDGCPFASPLFRRLAGRGSFFRGFPFRWALQLTVSLARCLTYTMSCLFFAALWLHRSQSVLLQGIQPAKDINLICYKTLPTKSVTCLQVGPRPLSARRLYLQDPTNPTLHFPMKIYSTNNEETLSLLLHIYVGGAMLFNNLKYNKVV